MDTADKIARYQEIERRGLLDRLPQEKQMMWAEYKKRNGIAQQPKEYPPAVKWAAERMAKEGRTDPSLWEKAVVGLAGAGEGAGAAVDRFANGLTMGATDYAQRKLGIDPNETVDDIIKSAKSPLGAGLAGMASNFAEIGGGMASGSELYKAAQGLASGAIGKTLAGIGTSGAMGGVRGGFASDFDPVETAKSAGKAMLWDAGIRAGLYGLDKTLSAVDKIRNVPRSFDEAAGTKAGSRVLNRAVRESDKIAEEVYRKTPEAKEALNTKAMDKLDDAVRGGVDVNGRVSAAKKDYSATIEANKGKQIFENRSASYKDLGLDSKLSGSQKEALDKAWKYGVKQLKDGEAVGSLKHLDKIKENLNDQINKSMAQNETGVGLKATSETVALKELKGYLQETMDKAGLSKINQQYAQAKSLETARDMGLKYNPNSVKTRDLNFRTPEEKSAFAQGLVEKIKMNPETKSIADSARSFRGVLRKVLGEKSDTLFKEIDKIDRAYKNVDKIYNNASRKLAVPEPINGKFGLLREAIESPGSVPGALADYSRRMLTAGQAERAAKYILNPNIPVGQSIGDILRPLIPGTASYISTPRKKGE